MSDEEKYSIKEVLEKYMQDSKETMEDISSDVKEIKLQVNLDSGRTSRLEWWRNGVVWAMGILISFIGVMVPVVIRFVEKVNKIDFTVSTLQDNYDK